jgi:hypothetical protein
MSLAPRRPPACIFCLLVLPALAWPQRADAQGASSALPRRVVILVLLPSASRFDASRLRAEIGDELGADVVTREDPLAPVATGTLTVGLDPTGAAVTVRYVARAAPVARQMDLPPRSDAAERAVALLAGNLARDESAELELAVRDRRARKAPSDVDDTVVLRDGGRIRGVVIEESPALGVRISLPDGTTRGLAPSEVERVIYGHAPSDAPSGRQESTVRFGFGAEPVLWYVPAASTTDLGGRVFGRMSLDLSPRVAVRVDLGAGVLESAGRNVFGEETTSLPLAVRADLELGATRHYAVSLGLDVGVDVARISAAPRSAVDPQGFTGGGTATNAEGIVGFHASPLTLRFGHANQFQLSAQEGVVFFLGQTDNPAFEQTLSVAVLFGSRAGS